MKCDGIFHCFYESYKKIIKKQQNNYLAKAAETNDKTKTVRTAILDEEKQNGDRQY